MALLPLFALPSCILPATSHSNPPCRQGNRAGFNKLGPGCLGRRAPAESSRVPASAPHPHPPFIGWPGAGRQAPVRVAQQALGAETQQGCGVSPSLDVTCMLWEPPATTKPRDCCEEATGRAGRRICCACRALPSTVLPPERATRGRLRPAQDGSVIEPEGDREEGGRRRNSPAAATAAAAEPQHHPRPRAPVRISTSHRNRRARDHRAALRSLPRSDL
jgi:hypothetical protein